MIKFEGSQLKMYRGGENRQCAIKLHKSLTIDATKASSLTKVSGELDIYMNTENRLSYNSEC